MEKKFDEDFDYAYYVNLRDNHGKPSRAIILSQINLRGLIIEGKWVEQGNDIDLYPDIESIHILKQPKNS